MWVNVSALRRHQTTYGLKQPNGYEFYFPAGAKVLSVRPDGVKIQYRYGDIETVSTHTKFKISK